MHSHVHDANNHVYACMQTLSEVVYVFGGMPFRYLEKPFIKSVDWETMIGDADSLTDEEEEGGDDDDDDDDGGGHWHDLETPDVDDIRQQQQHQHNHHQAQKDDDDEVWFAN